MVDFYRPLSPLGLYPPCRSTVASACVATSLTTLNDFNPPTNHLRVLCQFDKHCCLNSNFTKIGIHVKPLFLH